ncbi:MAG: hypothetical protein JJU33_09145 [Phycisphaerales bacterium]|nr:hypothetical protein [Phycisphaerales bacterium]
MFSEQHAGDEAFWVCVEVGGEQAEAVAAEGDRRVEAWAGFVAFGEALDLGVDNAGALFLDTGIGDGGGVGGAEVEDLGVGGSEREKE